MASSGTFSDVILGCRDEQRGALAAGEIASAPSTPKTCTISSHQLTIGDKASHETFGRFIETKYGKVDVLINNAGMAFKNADPTPFKEQCKPTIDVNFRGAAHFTEEILPLVRKGHDARIVNVASMAGHLSQLLIIAYSFLCSIFVGSKSLSTEQKMLTRIAVVTGANKGIGFHIAQHLASSGTFSDVT